MGVDKMLWSGRKWTLSSCRLQRKAVRMAEGGYASAETSTFTGAVHSREPVGVAAVRALGLGFSSL